MFCLEDGVLGAPPLYLFNDRVLGTVFVSFEPALSTNVKRTKSCVCVFFPNMISHGQVSFGSIRLKNKGIAIAYIHLREQAASSASQRWDPLRGASQNGQFFLGYIPTWPIF